MRCITVYPILKSVLQLNGNIFLNVINLTKQNQFPLICSLL